MNMLFVPQSATADVKVLELACEKHQAACALHEQEEARAQALIASAREARGRADQQLFMALLALETRRKAKADIAVNFKVTPVPGGGYSIVWNTPETKPKPPLKEPSEVATILVAPWALRAK